MSAFYRLPAALLILAVVFSPSALAQVADVSSTAAELPFFSVVGIVSNKSVRFRMDNCGPGDVTFSAIDGNNDTVHLFLDEQLMTHVPFGDSKELTLKWTADGDTELLSLTLFGDFSSDQPDPSIREGECVPECALLEAKALGGMLHLKMGSNVFPYDLVNLVERNGEELPNSGIVIPKYGSTDQPQLEFLEMMNEGDDLYAALMPKDDKDGTGPLIFAAFQNWRSDCSRRRMLRAQGNAVIDRKIGPTR
ncbi:unnamed protein product [Vitrella brassicaformis CCMP3155]|uniref:Uncharacterized protein n=2 Tax=Vitrella brassicaformis TaxID=1169539 RepID=A0A0G4GRZ3_VITBC|nr:unnamed protein product [Vitrella brassicaformis CCMP3155]|mmetsp:Transcript_15784/g.37644  ORF Transcript_15784/g.37644 Transcript_15784/m.37644 type:complete len:250 (+) Transcript_15784:163-912(+)|eukprot:CEM33382.1 unnamed protein product [Vitrella brassicaformis CCMP3155]